MALNAKQRLFVNQYLRDRNATRAYIAAGYSSKGAGVAAHKLLKNTKVKIAVEKGLARLEAKIEVSAERVIRTIAELAFHTTDIKKSDKLKACELLGKHFGQFKDVQEITGKDGGPQVILTMPANDSEVKKPDGSS